MSHKTKHKKKKHSHSKPNKGTGEQEMSGDGSDVKVHGAIEVHVAPSLIGKHDAERREDTTQKRNEYTVSIAAVIVAAVYSGLTLILVIVSVVSIWYSRRHFVQDQRPYVWESSIDFSRIEKGQQLKANIHFVNYGKSPAVREGHIGELFYGKDARQKAEAWFNTLQDQKLDSGAIVPPGIPADLNHTPLYSTLYGPVLSEDQAREIQAVSEGVSLGVRMWYYDTYGRPYRTDICAIRFNNGSWTFCKPTELK